MKRAPNLDRNHKEVVAYLEKLGFAVLSLASMGGGCPDILISNATDMWLAEIKDGNRGKFTSDQKAFYRRWKGKPVVVIYDKPGALKFKLALEEA